ncbi:methyltransferase domain-containing protein [Nonomuraea rhizosphaerae]|uniref:methyltransferase domain-containing protein n=1 Tax=Nonomuraea rhizosphaerae TaxID=2665663 RepID=UPI001FEC695F|nr:methyltransferase domain-containing protein [Nonomuraea rhizosphaerae]
MRKLAVARAVRGIEPLVAAEIRRAGLGAVRGVRHREVWFETAETGPALTGLRMADDVLLVGAVVEGVGRDRTALERLAGAAREIDPAGLLKAEPDGVEVSASFLGRRNYGRFDIEDAVGGELARTLRLPYHSRRDGRVPPEGAAGWRVTVEGDRAVIGLRVSGRPLHRRAYKVASVPGTLHPPVAAAMAWLARLGDARTVLDPCCGAGTTIVEARALAPRARLLGLDLAVDAAKVNGESGAAFGVAGEEGGVAFAVADAGRIPLPDAGVDRVLVNPPWDRQVPPAGLLRRDPGRLWREIRRVLADDGLVVALMPEDARTGLVVDRLVVDRTVRISLAGQHPAIAVLRKPGRASPGSAG